MTGTSRFLFRIVRGIAGRERAEWVEAMAAEAEQVEDSARWALGCLWASIKDRLARERKFLLAILLTPVGAYLLAMAVFFPLAWLFVRQLIPAWVLVGAGLLSPLPFGFILGRMRPGLPAYLASTISFAIAVMIPLTIFWLKFGKSPFSWFGDDATWYMMSPLAGLGSALLVWFVGVWIGSRWRRRSA